MDASTNGEGPTSVLPCYRSTTSSSTASNRLAALKSSFEGSSLHQHNHVQPQTTPLKRPTRDAVPKIASLFAAQQQQCLRDKGHLPQSSPGGGYTNGNGIHSPNSISGLKSPDGAHPSVAETTHELLNTKNLNSSFVRAREEIDASVSGKLTERDKGAERQSYPLSGAGLAATQGGGDWEDRRKSCPVGLEDHVVRFQHAKQFFLKKEEATKGSTPGSLGGTRGRAGTRSTPSPSPHFSKPGSPEVPCNINHRSHETISASSTRSRSGAWFQRDDTHQRSSSESRVAINHSLRSDRVRPDLLPNREPDEKKSPEREDVEVRPRPLSVQSTGNSHSVPLPSLPSPVEHNWNVLTEKSVVTTSGVKAEEKSVPAVSSSTASTFWPTKPKEEVKYPSITPKPRVDPNTPKESPSPRTSFLGATTTPLHTPEKEEIIKPIPFPITSRLSSPPPPLPPSAEMPHPQHPQLEVSMDPNGGFSSPEVPDDGSSPAMLLVLVGSGGEKDEYFDPDAPPMPAPFNPIAVHVNSRGLQSDNFAQLTVVEDEGANEIGEDDLELMTEEEQRIFLRGPAKDRLEETNIQNLRGADLNGESHDDDEREDDENSTDEVAEEVDEERQPPLPSRRRRRTEYFGKIPLGPGETEEEEPEPDLPKTVFDLYPRTILHDGHCYVEIPMNKPIEDDYPDDIRFRKESKVRFNVTKVVVYSTYSMHEYDRRNDDVDPVAASAEYELEKRIEKMDVFPVELFKESTGLGLSIIGMGVGADAGLEKLGIFIKSVGGPAGADGRIKVNDQIIEVDGQSLVGVTQSYAAQVLRATEGKVRFIIGRERENEQSEISTLIEQSKIRDRERDRQLEEEAEKQAAELSQIAAQEHGHNGESLPDEARNFSTETGLNDDQDDEEEHTEDSDDELEESYEPHTPTAELGPLGERDEGSKGQQDVSRLHYARRLTATDSLSPVEYDIDNLKLRLAEAQQFSATAEAEVNRLRSILEEYENEKHKSEDLVRELERHSQQLKTAEECQRNAKKAVTDLQEQLTETQARYSMLERKYNKAKKLIKDFQVQLEQRDKKYSSIIATLTEQISSLESKLEGKNRGPHPPSQLNSTPLSTASVAVNISRSPLINKLVGLEDFELSDTDDVDGRGSPSQSIISSIAPQDNSFLLDESFSTLSADAQLLDNTAARSRADLASKGSLACRQPPSIKRPSLEENSSPLHKTSPQRPAIPPPAVPARPTSIAPVVPRMSSVQQRPRQSSQISVTSSVSGISVTQDDSVVSKVGLTKKASVTYASLPRSFSKGSINRGSSMDSGNSIKTSPSSLSDSTGESSKQSSPEKAIMDNATDWTSHHVQQWLITYGLQQHIPSFANHKVDGPRLLILDSDALKELGVHSSAERAFMKKKIKEMRSVFEKEKKTVEKQRKAQEKLRKKKSP